MAALNGNINAGVPNRASMSILPAPLYSAANLPVNPRYDVVPKTRGNVYEQADAPLEF
jgi:hypothetical protein